MKRLLKIGWYLIIVGIVYGVLIIIAELYSFYIFFISLPMVITGIAFLFYNYWLQHKDLPYLQNGICFTGKIYKFEDVSGLLYGRYNLTIRYFDSTQNVREAIVEVISDTDDYPVGLSIDIYFYKGKFVCDSKSLRYEELPNEAYLMELSAIEFEKATFTVLSCPNCGKSLKVAVGYTIKCPNCGGYVKA